MWSMLGNARPWITVYRDGEVFVFAVEETDRFPFRNGDEPSVQPEDRWVRTPEGHVHIPVAPGLACAFRRRSFEFKGFSVKEHLINLTGIGTAGLDGHRPRSHRELRTDHASFSGDDFLEIGSGAGCDVFQLLDLLGSEGRYAGIDVQRESIVWCQNNIGRRHPNLRFHHFNAYHELHSPISTKTTLDTRVPVPDASADRVALIGVHAHFRGRGLALPQGARSGDEAGGPLLCDLLPLFGGVGQALCQNNVTGHNFAQHQRGEGCYINDLQYPTGAVAFTGEKIETQ